MGPRDFGHSFRQEAFQDVEANIFMLVPIRPVRLGRQDMGVHELVDAVSDLFDVGGQAEADRRQSCTVKGGGHGYSVSGS